MAFSWGLVNECCNCMICTSFIWWIAFIHLLQFRNLNDIFTRVWGRDSEICELSIIWSLLELSALLSPFFFCIPSLLFQLLSKLAWWLTLLHSYVFCLLFWGVCVCDRGVSLNGMKQNACHLPFHDHFGHIVSATSKPGNSVNSRTNLNAACMQEGYLLFLI